MNLSLVFGIISGLSLVLGAVVGLYFQFKSKTMASLMAFGSGILLSAITFGLIDEAFTHGGFESVIIGFLSGGILFLIGDYFLHQIGARTHRRYSLIPTNKDTNGLLIVLGALLDGIPESVALGVVLFGQQNIGILMLVAIALSNFPESASSVPGLIEEKFSKNKIFFVWLIVGILTAVVVWLSFVFLHDLHPKSVGVLEAFAAGAILMMLSDSMIPEAYKRGGFGVAFFTLFGFLTSFIISRINLTG
jgi:zinc transporter, ZIP family